MTSRYGFRHMQFTTRDLEATRAFWHDILRFPIVLQDEIPAGDGETLPREIYDIGNQTYVIFLDISDHPRYAKVDTSLYGGLNRPSMAYHFAFDVGSTEQLVAKHEYLKSRGVAMSEISYMIDWSAQFYFPEPVNGIQLEYTSVRFIPGRQRDLERRYRESSKAHWLDYLKVVTYEDDDEPAAERPREVSPSAV